jgi:hypothetical protein
MIILFGATGSASDQSRDTSPGRPRRRDSPSCDVGSIGGRTRRPGFRLPPEHARRVSPAKPSIVARVPYPAGSMVPARTRLTARRQPALSLVVDPYAASDPNPRMAPCPRKQSTAPQWQLHAGATVETAPRRITVTSRNITCMGLKPLLKFGGSRFSATRRRPGRAGWCSRVHNVDVIAHADPIDRRPQRIGSPIGLWSAAEGQRHTARLNGGYWSVIRTNA